MLHRAPDDDAKGRCLQLTRPGNEDGGISNKEDLDRGRIPMQDEFRPSVDGIVRAKSSHGGSSCVKKGETESGKAMDIKEMPRVKADVGLGLDIADACAQQANAVRSGEEGDDLSENDQPKNDAHKDDAARARNMALQVSVSHGVRQAQLLQQQQQAPAVRWERFLPQRQLRVLLVEDDDSTRHVVSALLRNCSYEVTSAANGLLAWEILLDQTCHVDLVLTEVAMPSLSGIGLLSRIMGHQAYKHIPVIMMSSHDSMSIVFKCLSRGAVDFIVKPVRKNELKNLWQHVWRRCHSSSGSGSGSGSGSLTQKATPAEGAADCNNSGSNDESDNASSGLNVRGGSDNGSGTQSSWTKRAVEVESCHQRHRDSSHGNAILSQQAEKGCASAAEVLEKEGSDIAIGEDLELATVGFTAAELKKEDRTKTVCLVAQNDPDTIIKNAGRLEQGIGSGSSQENSQRAIDLIGAIACNGGIVKEEQGDSRDEEDLLEKHASNSPSSKDKTLSDSSSPASLELTLKRPRHREEDNKEKDGRYVLRHSCSSAFSRYNNNNNNHIPVNLGNPLPTLQSKPAGFTGPGFQHVSGVGSSSQSSFPLPTQIDRVASSKDRTDGGQSLPFLSHTCHGIGKQESSFPSGKECISVCTGKEESLPSHLVPGTGAQASLPLTPPFYDGLPSAAFGPMSHPLFYAGAAAAHWAATPSVPERGEVDGGHVSYEQSQAQPNNQHSQIHHHSHHHHHHHIQHHYHHHQHAPQQRARTPQQEDQTVTNVGTSAPLCGSSNMAEVVNGQSGSSNGNNGNISLNCSATGSNNGSNGHSNAQSAAGQTAGGYTDGYTDGNQGGNGSSGAGTGFTVAHGVLSGADQNRFARREAALTKFRQKRKERCFEKKVRYQSRKRLAEQRPRVRGQFVRQSVYESINNEPD